VGVLLGQLDLMFAHVGHDVVVGPFPDRLADFYPRARLRIGAETAAIGVPLSLQEQRRVGSCQVIQDVLETEFRAAHRPGLYHRLRRMDRRVMPVLLHEDVIRSDNGSEFTAKAVRDWLGRVNVKTLYIEPGSSWENSCNESFNGKLRDELLNGEIFYTLKEAKVLIEQWRCHYNTIRPHSALGYRPPAPETTQSQRIDLSCALVGLQTDRRFRQAARSLT
jgi:hypothetical protein